MPETAFKNAIKKELKVCGHEQRKLGQKEPVF
jgi:hypothetical protein